MITLDVGGYWWLPGKEQAKRPGFLTFDAATGITLRLIGTLVAWEEVAPRTEANGIITSELTEQTFTKAGIYDRILGEAEGKIYTLEDCFESYRSVDLFSGAGRQVLHANRLFVDVHFEDGELAGGDGLIVQPDGLTNWIGRSGVRTEAILEKNAERLQFRMEGSPLPESETALANGSELILQHYMHIDNNVNSPAIRQDFAFKLRYPAIIPAQDLADVASDIQDLVSIGTGRTAAFDSLTVFHPQVAVGVGDHTRELPIEFIAQWIAVRTETSTPLQQYEIYFTLEDLGGIIGVAKWLDVAEKHRETLSRVMATRYSLGMYVSDKYLNRIASLEALDRQLHQDRLGLRNRLRRCVRTAGEPILRLVNDVEQWIDVLVRDRNDIAHHLARRPRAERPHMYFFAESAYWLYACCLLRVADAPETVFTKVVQHPSYEFLQRRLAELLG